MIDIRCCIQQGKQQDASDIHITENSRPILRRHGQLMQMGESAAEREDILGLLDVEQLRMLENGHDLDFALSLCGGRQRVHVYRSSMGLAMAIRLLRDHIPTLEELRLPPVLSKLADEPRGLVLVTGPTGSGKSTTLAAMIQYIARCHNKHIITIEDPIEYVYGYMNALIHQREVGHDVKSFSSALRSVMREDPDVIFVGEMRDYETISAALTAAETGHLVISTLHTAGAAKTVDRIVDVFPPHAQGQIRSQLEGVLKGVISQQLLPKTPDNNSGAVNGRIVATEVLLGTDAVANLIREGKGHQIGTVIQSNASLGMMSMDGCMAAMVRQGLITRETAMLNTSNPNELAQFLH